MNIKSLLLGSAAAMVAVSGAQAADAVVVEAEPVEYVRVCDAYGSGFFFIPGTETCIRFGGFVRSSYEKTSIEFDDGTETDLAFWGQRARLNIDVRSETDWGTLRALYRLEGGDSNVDADVDMDIALISLAGFRAGFAGANYWSTNHGFAGVNLTGLGGTSGIAQDDGYYGFNDATIFDYTFAADGFSVTVGVEDPRIDYAGLGFVGSTFSGGLGGTGIPALALAPQGSSDTRANFYAGFNYSADFGSVAFTAVRDGTAVDSAALAAGIVDQGGWAYKVSLSLDLSEFIPGGILYGSYANDGDYITNYVHTNGSGIDDAESIWQISFQADLTDELQLVAQHSNATGSDWGLLAGVGEEEQQATSIGLNWFPAAAPQFSLRASYTFGDVENAVGAVNGPAGNYDFDSFFVGVRRDF
jgi:hypothetical protein